MPRPRRAAPHLLAAGALLGAATSLSIPAHAARAQDPQATADSAIARSRAVANDTAGVARLALARSRARRAVVREGRTSRPGILLRQVLARPHLVVVPETTLVLGRDVRVDSSLVVLGTTFTAARVRGDVVVLGDLFLRPGAVIEGRAIAIGGGVYPSALSEVRGATLAFRDVEPRRRPLDAVPLSESRALAVDLTEPRPAVLVRGRLAGLAGLRIPLYDRIDGVTATFGPEFALDTGRVRVEPTVAYRSHLGAVDPALRVLFEPRTGRQLALRVERGTFSNDAWIRSDLVNSATVLGAGVDVRNYYRADRAELVLRRRLARGETTLSPYVGVRAERSWSVRRDSGATSAPWSLIGRDDPEGVRRANPAVTGGGIGSALAGVEAQGAAGGWLLEGGLQLEGAPVVRRGSAFVQTTLDLRVGRPVRTTHLAEAFAHVVLTPGATAPSQRWAYLGGSGTLPSLLLLERGGDELAFGELRYTVPVPGIKVPYLGEPPRLSARWIAGGAGVNRLGRVTQNVGLRLAVGFLRIEYLLDPTGEGRRAFDVGIGLVR